MLSLRLAACALLCALFTTIPAAVVREKRETSDSQSSTTSASEKAVCQHRMPCGWAVYVPFTRRLQHFLKNTCECSPDKNCVKTDDDLSISAYVFRCKENVAAGEETFASLSSSHILSSSDLTT